jgi:hypothetical protein
VTVLRIQHREFLNLFFVGLLEFPLEVFATYTHDGVAAVAFNERDITGGTLDDGIIRVVFVLQTGDIIMGDCRASETMWG